MQTDLSASEREHLVARIAALETLQNIARDLTAELNLETLLEKILRAAWQVCHSTAGTLFLYDSATHEPGVQSDCRRRRGRVKEKRISVDLGIAGESFIRQSRDRCR